MALVDRLLSAETRRFLSFGSSSLALTLSNMIGGVVALRWVPPELMGPWQATLLLQAYCEVLKLGVINGMNREFQFRMGQGNVVAAEKSLATTLAWLRISSLSGLAAFACLGVLNWDKGSVWQVAAVTAALQWVLAYYTSYVQATLRGSDDFAKLSAIQYFGAIAGLALLPLVAVWGFWGFCARSLLQALVLTIPLRAVMKLNPKAHLDRAELFRLLATGFPLFIASYLFQLGMNAERSALLSANDDHLLGLFAPVAAVLSAVLVLPNAAALYIYPQLSRGLGKERDPSKLWDLAWGNTRTTAIVALGVAISCWFLAEPMTELLFPAYIEAVPAMRWAALTGVFLAFRPMSTALPALQAWRWHYLWVVCFVISKVMLCAWFVSLGGDPLVAVAQAAALSAAIAAVLIFVGVRRATRNPYP